MKAHKLAKETSNSTVYRKILEAKLFPRYECDKLFRFIKKRGVKKKKLRWKRESLT